VSSKVYPKSQLDNNGSNIWPGVNGETRDVARGYSKRWCKK